MKEKTSQQEYEESKGLISAANEASERLENALKEHREVAAKMEAIVSRINLGGRSEANANEEPKPETPKQYKDRVMSGRA